VKGALQKMIIAVNPVQNQGLTVAAKIAKIAQGDQKIISAITIAQNISLLIIVLRNQAQNSLIFSLNLVILTCSPT
jgi:hypothetical protein